jgi:glycosyltransferase involved in cell wall biosynthesis/peptidoglycan/xylan/chitin deacetylase (PgdA/CDA1 family)
LADAGKSNLKDFMKTPIQKKPLTVMFLIDRLWKIGGAERNLILLSKNLKANGHKVIISCLKGGELTDKMRKEGLFVRDLDINKIYNWKGLKTLFSLVKVAKQEKVNVIMTYHESSDLLGLLVSILAKVPIVSNRRDMGFKLKSRHIWLYRFLNRFFDHITAVSSAVREAIVKTQWTKPSHISVIYNGIDPFPNSGSAFDFSSKSEFNDGHLHVCCVANIHQVKGHKTLIDAASIVLKRFPNVRFFFIGTFDPNDTYYKELQKQMEDLNLENTINFTGRIHHEDLPSILSAMDISVLSSMSEGLSNSLLESMSAGIPVIATAVGGNVEVIEDGKTGFLVSPDDPQSLAEALLKLLGDPERRSEMGLQGKFHVEDKFNLSMMLQRYDDVLYYVHIKNKLGRWRDFNSRFSKKIHSARSWIKIFLSSVSYYSGLVFVWRRVKKILHLGRVKILCFHDVSEMAEGRSKFNIFIKPDYFSKLLDFLTQNYQVVSLEEVTRLLQDGQPLTDDVFALTFDDCYKGWIDYVLPNCKQLHLPYAVFVTTEPLDTGRPLLYDTLIFLTENTWRKVADLSSWKLGVFLLDNPNNIFHFVENTHEWFQEKSNKDRADLLYSLSEYLGVSLNSEKLRNSLLNWDDLRKMDMDNVTIGAHTVSHNCLRNLPDPECFLEISQSKKRLEEELGHSIRFFAYPYGAQDHYERNTTKLVAKAGFHNAFTSEINNHHRFQPFEIGRLGVSYGMFIGPNGNFQKALLATELCGLGDLMFGRVFTQKKQRNSSKYM